MKNITKAEIVEMLHKKAVEAISEIKIRKIVNRKGKITKRQTAGLKGKKVVGGKVTTQTSAEKKHKKLGQIQKKRTLKKKSQTQKKRSIAFAVKGRAKRAKLNIK